MVSSNLPKSQPILDIFLPYEARAEILVEIGWLFGRFEDTKISFWDYLTFSILVTSMTPQRHYIFDGLITYHLRQADCTVATHKNVPLMVSLYPYFLVLFGNLPTLFTTIFGFIFCMISYFLVRCTFSREIYKANCKNIS